jgi:hypothetical protein
MAVLLCMDSAMVVYQYQILIFYISQGDAYKETEE